MKLRKFSSLLIIWLVVSTIGTLGFIAYAQKHTHIIGNKLCGADIFVPVEASSSNGINPGGICLGPDVYGKNLHLTDTSWGVLAIVVIIDLVIVVKHRKGVTQSTLKK